MLRNSVSTTEGKLLQKANIKFYFKIMDCIHAFCLHLSQNYTWIIVEELKNERQKPRRIKNSSENKFFFFLEDGKQMATNPVKLNYKPTVEKAAEFQAW